MNATILNENGRRPADGLRLVGLERHYHCSSCSGEHCSWSKLRSCPDCGEALHSARIRRAAVA